mmetsp:Transcript_31545/g.65890  ORF Transcript_31545/g.65890 Transcript_31545/m.65890 type:complete len:751 (-) Transcript_31545:249-2501(-)
MNPRSVHPQRRPLPRRRRRANATSCCLTAVLGLVVLSTGSSTHAFCPTGTPLLRRTNPSHSRIVAPIIRPAASSSRRFYAMYEDHDPTAKRHRSLYHVLGISREATMAEIKQAFRQLAKQYHPDAVQSSHNNDNDSQDKDDITRRFQEINQAYQILSDPEARRRYDMETSTVLGSGKVPFSRTSATSGSSAAQPPTTTDEKQDEDGFHEQRPTSTSAEDQGVVDSFKHFGNDRPKQQQPPTHDHTAKVSAQTAAARGQFGSNGFDSNVDLESVFEFFFGNGPESPGYYASSEYTQANQRLEWPYSRMNNNSPFAGPVGTVTPFPHLGNSPFQNQSPAFLDGIEQHHREQEQQRQRLQQSSWKHTHVAATGRHYEPPPPPPSERREWPYNRYTEPPSQSSPRPPSSPWTKTHVAAPGAWTTTTTNPNTASSSWPRATMGNSPRASSSTTSRSAPPVMAGEWATSVPSSSTWPRATVNPNAPPPPSDWPHTHLTQSAPPPPPQRAPEWPRRSYGQTEPSTASSRQRYRATRPTSSAIPQTGDDIRTEIAIDLKTSQQGGDKLVQIQQYQACPTCQGQQEPRGAFPVTCGDCEGTGKIHVPSKTPRTVWQKQQDPPCPICQGQGTLEQIYACTSCQGQGRSLVVRQLKVKIPPHTANQSQLKVVGSGHAGIHGGSAGDLYLKVHLYTTPQEEEDEGYTHHTQEVAFGQEQPAYYEYIPRQDPEFGKHEFLQNNQQVQFSYIDRYLSNNNFRID